MADQEHLCVADDSTMVTRLELDFLRVCCIKVGGNIMSKAEDGAPISGILEPEAGETLAVRDRDETKTPTHQSPGGAGKGMGARWRINTKAGHPERGGSSARQDESCWMRSPFAASA